MEHWPPITQTRPVQFYLVFAATTAETVAAALLSTAALYLAGGEKVENFRGPSKGPSAFLMELLTLRRWKRKTEERNKK